MKDYSYTMEPYTLQSYFKSLCESFCIVYKQLEKLEKSEKKQPSAIAAFWTAELLEHSNRISSIIKHIYSTGSTIIVTSKQEVLAIINFYRTNSVDRYRIINLDNDLLEVFPKDEMSEEFLKAYCSSENEYMKKLCDKFF